MEPPKQTKSRTSNRLFLLTGFSNEDKNKLLNMITDLGGKFKETMEFVPDCTHVISAKPIRSEKFLCGCASGKWVLTPKYVCDSFSIRRWLDEEHYEWTTAPTMKTSDGILAAPKRWRLHVQKECRGAFADWTVLIMVENKYRRPFVYKRLIEAGGGKTISLSQGSLKNKEMFVDCVTHVVVDRCYSNDVQVFARGGVPCLHPEYLAEFLFKTDAQMEPFLVTNHVKRSVTKKISEGPSSHCENGKNNITEEKSAIPQQSEAKPEFKAPLAPTSSAIQVPKRKLQALKGIEEALEARKRQKIERCKPCVPPWVKSVYKSYKSKDHPKAVPFSQAQMHIIEADIEEKQWFDALSTIKSYLSPQHYPHAELLHLIMQQMLKTEDRNLGVACQKVLQAMLCMHSPATNPEMTGVYLDAFLDGPKDVNTLHKFLATTDLWDYLYHVIKLATHQSKTSHQPKQSVKTDADEEGESVISDKSKNATLLLEFLVFQIEDDFTAWKNRQEYGLPSSSHGTMISRILWPGVQGLPSRITSVPFKQLIKVTIKSLLKTPDPTVISQQVRCVRPLLSVINMAAEYCTHKECDMSSTATGLNLAGDRVTDFSSAIASQIIEAGIHEDVERLSFLLCSLKPAWLKLKVVQAILDRRHQSVLEEQESEQMKTMPLSLRKIVDFYLWMVPEFKKIIPPAPKKSLPEEKVGRSLVRPLGDSNIDKNNNDENEAMLKRKMAASINERNRKGETPLHVACIKNNLDKLKQLLTVPGINVNDEDNAGWTPLHEAANHGHASCVKELLDFKPKMDSSVKDISCKPVNLLAAPAKCGTTPLHDAVRNNRIDCARLLVQAGGEAVLSAKNKQGFTPVNMAVTDEMLAVLRQNSTKSSDHNKENLADSQVKLRKEKPLSSSEGDTSSFSCRLPDYANLFGPCSSRPNAVSQQKCECYCLLAHHLLLSYIKVKELAQLKQEMLKCKNSQVPRKDSLRNNLMSSTQCIQSHEGDRPAKDLLHSNRGESPRSYSEKDVIYDDMEVFSSLTNHVKLFSRHIETVGAWEHGLKDSKQCYTAVQKMKLLARDDYHFL